MIDSTGIGDAKTGIELLITAVGAVTAFIGFVAGRIHALRKKKR